MSLIPGPSERTVPNWMVHPLPAKPPDPDKRDPPMVLSKGSHPTSGNLSHLLSLSTAQILACAHQLLDPPPTDISAPKPTVPPKPNTSADPSISPDPEGQPFDALTTSRYKAANCVHPILMTLPEEHRILHCIPSIPLISLPVLPKHPPDFTPSEKFTEERRVKMNINPLGCLWPEEEKLVLFLIKAQEEAITWDLTQPANFRKDYFKPIIIPTVPHMPWVERNIPIPPGIYDEVIRIIKGKIRIGIYERSNSSYQLKWICILKKDGKSLRIIHDLQPLNVVTVKDSGVPPILEFYAENLGGQGSYTWLNLFVAFDYQNLAVQSQGLTTFQMPLGLLHLATLPMGATNSIQILQGDISFIIQEEIPNIAAAFMDDVNVRGPPTCYETDSSGWYASTAFTDLPPQSAPVPCALGSDGNHFEVIPENTGICQFAWEHLNNINCVLQHVKKVGGMFSGWKMDICVPEVMAIGHNCTYEKFYPEDCKVSEDYRLARLQYPNGGLRFPRCMWHHPNLGQGFCETHEAPC